MGRPDAWRRRRIPAHVPLPLAFKRLPKVQVVAAEKSQKRLPTPPPPPSHAPPSHAPPSHAPPSHAPPRLSFILQRPLRPTESGRARGRAQKRARGAPLVASPGKNAQLDIQISQSLASCRLLQLVTSRRCDEPVTQQGYFDLTSTQTLNLRDDRGKELGTLHYSVMDSIMSHLASTSPHACVAGRIELVLYGDPTSASQRVIDAATRLELDLKRSCSTQGGIMSIYIVLEAQWIKNPDAVARAEHLGGREAVGVGARVRPGFACDGDCITGHAMAIILSPSTKSIEFYEPNGKNAEWYPVVADYLKQLFAGLPMFQGYTVRENDVCPAYGVQAGSGLPLCSYFATLYAAIRIMCPELSPETVITDLLALGKQRLPQLIRQWHCFLVEYAERVGILDAADNIGTLFNQVIARLINLPSTINRAPFWDRLREIEDIVVLDLLAGQRQLASLLDDLKRVR